MIESRTTDSDRHRTLVLMRAALRLVISEPLVSDDVRAKAVEALTHDERDQIGSQDDAHSEGISAGESVQGLRKAGGGD